jgi:small-conductance mechanosensitive channel
MFDSNLLTSSNSTHIISSSIWMGSILTLLFCSMIAMFVLRRIGNKEGKRSFLQQWTNFLIRVAKKPFSFLFFSYLLYELSTFFFLYFPQFQTNDSVMILTGFANLLKIVEFIAFFWLALNTLNLGQIRLEIWSFSHGKRILSILLPMIGNSLKAVAILLMLNMLIPALGLSGLPNEFLQKLAKVALIFILAGLFVQLINGLEKLILNQYNQDISADPAARKINTQVRILKKVILALGMVIAVAATLMVFDSVKNLGTGLLTTAGLVSAFGAFASQQSLSRIYSGLQIAFTQPVNIGDTIILDKESGQIEEITLSYIVVKMWDLRRVILSTDYFINKGLQNLSRASSELIGTVFFYTDYTLPVEDIRDQFQTILATSVFWNKKTGNFHVSDIKESSMELRALISADNSAALWELRCEIREKLMRFIVENYPDCMVKTRSLTTDGNTLKSRAVQEAEMQ